MGKRTLLIAVVEDNKALAEGIANTLRDRGHGVDVLDDGLVAQAHLEDVKADLVILDLALPGCSGLDVLKHMRARNDSTPVLILTAKRDVEHRISGLDAGADDYLGKPFSMDELEARVRALLRRRDRAGALETIGALTFDRDSRTLMVDGEPLDIPRRELAVFECLVQRKGRLVSKDLLVDFLYGSGADVGDSVCEVYISRLRKRIEPYGVSIKTARGLGYRLEHAE